MRQSSLFMEEVEGGMTRRHASFAERSYEKVEDLWLALSPTAQLSDGPQSYIYKGQGDATWQLIPSILRPRNQPPITSYEKMVEASEMFFTNSSA
jgi:hypothetical protein